MIQVFMHLGRTVGQGAGGDATNVAGEDGGMMGTEVSPTGELPVLGTGVVTGGEDGGIPVAGGGGAGVPVSRGGGVPVAGGAGGMH